MIIILCLVIESVTKNLPFYHINFDTKKVFALVDEVEPGRSGTKKIVRRAGRAGP